MPTQALFQSADYAQAIADLVVKMPIEHAAQIYNFVCFMQSRPLPVSLIVVEDKDRINASEPEIQNENLKSDQLLLDEVHNKDSSGDVQVLLEQSSGLLPKSIRSSTTGSSKRLVLDPTTGKLGVTETDYSDDGKGIPLQKVGAWGGLSVQDFIDMLATALATAGGLKLVVEVVKLWVEDRNGRKIKIKKGDFEIEISGGMSEKQIEHHIQRFHELSKEADDKIRIILPNE